MTKRLNKNSKVSSVVIFAFCAAIIIGMIAGFLGSKNLIDKQLAERIFIIAWVVGMNLWCIGAIISGEVNRYGGGARISRAVDPVGFWIFVVLNFIIFNTAGLLFIFGRQFIIK